MGSRNETLTPPSTGSDTPDEPRNPGSTPAFAGQIQPARERADGLDPHSV